MSNVLNTLPQIGNNKSALNQFAVDFRLFSKMAVVRAVQLVLSLL